MGTERTGGAVRVRLEGEAVQPVARFDAGDRPLGKGREGLAQHRAADQGLGELLARPAGNLACRSRYCQKPRTSCRRSRSTR